MKLCRLVWVFLAFWVVTQAHAQYQPPYATERWVQHFQIAKDWTVRRRIELDLKVLNDSGIDRLGEQTLAFNPKLESIRIIEAYTVQPDGSVDKVQADRIRTQDDPDDAENGIYGENKVKLIIFPKLKVGSRTHYVAEWLRHTPDFPGQFAFSVAFSPQRIIQQAEIKISHDASLPIRAQAIGMQEGAVTNKKGEVSRIFTYQQPEASAPQQGMLSVYDFAPRLFVTSFGSWADVAKAYQVRARPKAEPDARIQQLARELVEGTSNDLERADKIYRWIIANIRYLGVFSASGGYVPVAASQVLKERYGDCKGHATLFEAMLRAVGIESSQVLINTRANYQLPELPVYGRFDHVITYIPSLKLFLDATSHFVRFGALPSDLEGKPALLTATGEVLRTAITPAADDHTKTRTQLRLQTDGRVKGKSTTVQAGDFEQTSRGLFFSRQNKSKERVIQDILSINKETGKGKLTHPDPGDLSAIWETQSEFDLDPVINIEGLSAFQIPVGLTPGRFQVLASYKLEPDKKFPSACGSSTHDETIVIELPPHAKLVRLPKGQAYRSSVLTYQSSFEEEGSQIIVTRHFQANRPSLVCGTADDADWEAFSQVIRRDLRQQIFFETTH